jgi:uncharacterized protein (DUF885 family)
MMQRLQRWGVISAAVAIVTLYGPMRAGARQNPLAGSARSVRPGATALATDPDISDLLRPQSELRTLVERYETDWRALSRSQPVSFSPAGYARLQAFYAQWLAGLQTLDFQKLSQAGRIDTLLLRNHIEYERRRADIQNREQIETAPLLPFAPTIIELAEAKRRMEPLDAAKAAATIDALSRQVAQARKAAETGTPPKPLLALRAARTLDTLHRVLQEWYDFYNGYDPLFTWWLQEPYKGADHALQEYTDLLRTKLGGAKPGDPDAIVGQPIGREALLNELRHEMIPYTPEELIAIANREYAWCEGEMKKASRELGYGDDWRKALEHVKTLYVEPGKQPQMIRDLTLEAIKWVDDHDMVTIPPLAREIWRMEMMTPQQQKLNPFFTGGETISVSFPTNGMSHEQKMMSMRGNNIHFARATVLHEVIPGHHLQLFMADRYQTHRQLFTTPFLVEGWALYWEMLMWDNHFAQTPENRVGMLFWRMHRCARIIFSLSFHLEKMTPQECVDFLVERVGHERENAAAEVRRSFMGGYSPLYQCAYMIGGLQLRALHHDLVESGRMTNRAFHDAVLKENAIPVEMIRASLANIPLTRDYTPQWRFYDLPASASH